MLSAQPSYIGRPWLRPNAWTTLPPCNRLCTPCSFANVRCTAPRAEYRSPAGSPLVRAESCGKGRLESKRTRAASKTIHASTLHLRAPTIGFGAGARRATSQACDSQEKAGTWCREKRRTVATQHHAAIGDPKQQPSKVVGNPGIERSRIGNRHPRTRRGSRQGDRDVGKVVC